MHKSLVAQAFKWWFQGFYLIPPGTSESVLGIKHNKTIVI